MQQKQSMFILDRVEYPEEGGIFAYFQGTPYPAKGFPFPEALYAVNAVKRNTLSQLKSIINKDALNLFVGFALMRKKTKIRFLTRAMDEYAVSSSRLLDACYVKERYWSVFCKEMNRFIVNFLVAFGINELTAKNFAEVLTTIVDYDNAYRFRAEDIFSETSYEQLLAHPADEVARLIKILGEREPAQQNTDKFGLIGKMIRLGMWIPSVRKAFLSALKEMDITKLQYDEADRYHVLLWSDYNFLGKPIEERMKMYYAFHAEKLPPRLMYNPQ